MTIRLTRKGQRGKYRAKAFQRGTGMNPRRSPNRCDRFTHPNQAPPQTDQWSAVPARLAAAVEAPWKIDVPHPLRDNIQERDAVLEQMLRKAHRQNESLRTPITPAET